MTLTSVCRCTRDAAALLHFFQSVKAFWALTLSVPGDSHFHSVTALRSLAAEPEQQASLWTAQLADAAAFSNS